MGETLTLWELYRYTHYSDEAMHDGEHTHARTNALPARILGEFYLWDESAASDGRFFLLAWSAAWLGI